MAHVTYDIPLKGPVTPYVGVGLGAVGTHLKALGEDDGSVQFAWQLRAGAAVKVTRGVDLTADYTYRQTSGGKLQFGDDEDVVYRLGKTKASLFQVGLRFTF
jgi:opacity protein-like surface antigen